MATVEVVGKFHRILRLAVAKQGLTACPVEWRWVWKGWQPARSGEGGPAAWRLIYSANGIWRMAFSGLGAVVVSIGKGVGQPANQVKVGRRLGDCFTALWDLVRWHSPFARCGDDFRLFGFYRFCHGLRVVGVSPHGRGVLRIV